MRTYLSCLASFFFSSLLSALLPLILRSSYSCSIYEPNVMYVSRKSFGLLGMVRMVQAIMLVAVVVGSNSSCQTEEKKVQLSHLII